MGEINQHQTSSSRFGLRSGGGQIVQVQGGHILKSTARKDRHSKVCTAKGPRDRRVRLAAHTAIQFYDVQDRLGYDRPSKAVDWLIKKAKTAIDELEKLPAWKPTTDSTENEQTRKEIEEKHRDSAPNRHQQLSTIETIVGQGLHHTSTSSSIGFLPPSMDSDSISDTIKSFFPMGASTEANTSAMEFQSFPSPDLLSRTSNHSQDLKLSLQSFQDPIMLHHQHQQAQHNEQKLVQAEENATFFSGTTPVQLEFDGSGWSDHHQQPTESGPFQRFTAWNTDTGGGIGGGRGGYSFTSAPLQQFFGQNQFISQRGPLQSSYTPPVRSWMDPSAIAMPDNEHHQAMLLNYPPYLSGISSGFSGFYIPSRIQGDKEEHDGISDEPSSASSDSRP